MELLSPTLRKNIIEGKDVNLASLFIPYYDTSLPDKDDGHLKRSLSITEFITAFGKYKRVMCQAYPERCDELDQYESIIVGLHGLYGDRYYEYHKLFPSKQPRHFRCTKLRWICLYEIVTSYS